MWSQLEASGGIWSQLEASGGIWSHLKAAGIIWRHTRDTQETPREHPGSTQEPPEDTQEAPFFSGSLHNSDELCAECWTVQEANGMKMSLTSIVLDYWARGRTANGSAGGAASGSANKICHGCVWQRALPKCQATMGGLIYCRTSHAELPQETVAPDGASGNRPRHTLDGGASNREVANGPRTILQPHRHQPGDRLVWGLFRQEQRSV